MFTSEQLITAETGIACRRKSVALGATLITMCLGAATGPVHADAAVNMYTPFVFGASVDRYSNWIPPRLWPAMCGPFCIYIPPQIGPLPSTNSFGFISFDIAAYGRNPTGTVTFDYQWDLVSVPRIYDVECIEIADPAQLDEVEDGVEYDLVAVAYVRASSLLFGDLSIEFSIDPVDTNPVLRYAYPTTSNPCGFDENQVFDFNKFIGTIEAGYLDPA